jgi:outer membrane protein TolC
MNKIFVYICLLLSLQATGQKKKLILSLDECMRIAADSSLQAFQTKHTYLSAYWGYRSFKATLLPSISFQLTPVQYNSNITKRYDSETNLDVYRQQQSVSSNGGLSLAQNVTFTGGSLTVGSNLDYMHHFGDNRYTQYSSIPFRIGYSQALFGYNRFKFEKKIEPLKFEKAKRQFLYSREELSETVVGYFFALLSAQKELELAKDIVASTDSLFRAGKERSRISAISPADLLTLELNFINAENYLENAVIEVERNMIAFITFFNFDKEYEIWLMMPAKPQSLPVTADEALSLVKKNNPEILFYKQQLMEAEQNLENVKKNSGFNANLSASIGFNQAGTELAYAYKDPLRQEGANIGLTIPVLDWGERKGKVHMAENSRTMIRYRVLQDRQKLEMEVALAVAEFNRQFGLIQRTEKALGIASTSYQINKHRFIVGKTDINTVTLSQNQRDEAYRNHIHAMNNYWKYYFKLRKLTLYDFEKEEDLSFQFDRLLH